MDTAFKAIGFRVGTVKQKKSENMYFLIRKADYLLREALPARFLYLFHSKSLFCNFWHFDPLRDLLENLSGFVF